jgi:hypothetical protein
LRIPGVRVLVAPRREGARAAVAYKPIDHVMADAADLVTLRQLVNVKGD